MKKTGVWLAVFFTVFLMGPTGCTHAPADPDPLWAAQEYLGQQMEREDGAVLAYEFESAQVLEEETERIRQRYKDSDIAGERGWSQGFIDHMTAVETRYTVDYDNTKVPYSEGKMIHVLYLSREDENSPWEVFDSLTPYE